MKLFVGLGNPGAKYEQNRHNIGFLALDRIASSQGLHGWKKKFQGLAADCEINGERVLLLKPDTYMNESGRSVGEAARFLKIQLSDIYVFHDELDLAPGKIKIKTGGGNAGHNGLRSITAHLGNDYHRVRLGIGHPGSKDAVVHYVLGDFAKAERPWLDELLDAVAKSAGRLAQGDSARFLTDVAKELGTMEKGKAGTQKARPGAPGKPAKTQTRQTPASRHPAGERAAKQKSALAENLKKWLAGRASQKPENGN